MSTSTSEVHNGWSQMLQLSSPGPAIRKAVSKAHVSFLFHFFLFSFLSFFHSFFLSNCDKGQIIINRIHLKVLTRLQGHGTIGC